MKAQARVLCGLVGASVAGLISYSQFTARPATAQSEPTAVGAAAGAVIDRHGRPARGLTEADIRRIFNQAVAAANATDSGVRAVDENNDGDFDDAGERKKTRMHIAVVARNGRFLDIRSQADAWVGSIDIAIGKARTAAFFSSNQQALTSRIIGQLSQAHGPDGTGGAGPLWGIWVSNQPGIAGGPELRNGLIPFPGGVPLYKNGVLVGGVGVSGDGVEQDEDVALAGAAGFLPPTTIARLGFD